jgi:hypothetical protein
MKQAIPVVIDCSHIYGADFTAAKVTNHDNMFKFTSYSAFMICQGEFSQPRQSADATDRQQLQTLMSPFCIISISQLLTIQI